MVFHGQVSAAARSRSALACKLWLAGGPDILRSSQINLGLLGAHQVLSKSDPIAFRQLWQQPARQRLSASASRAALALELLGSLVISCLFPAAFWLHYTKVGQTFSSIRMGQLSVSGMGGGSHDLYKQIQHLLRQAPAAIEGSVKGWGYRPSLQQKARQPTLIETKQGSPD